MEREQKQPRLNRKGAGTTLAPDERLNAGAAQEPVEPRCAQELSPESHLATVNTYRNGFATGLKEWLRLNDLPVDVKLQLASAMKAADAKGAAFLRFPPSPLASLVASGLEEPLTGGSR